MSYKIGARVAHTSYGDGTVRDVNEYHTKIDFDEGGLRTFATPKVVLAIAQSAAPVKATTRARRKKAVPQADAVTS